MSESTEWEMPAKLDNLLQLDFETDASVLGRTPLVINYIHAVILRAIHAKATAIYIESLEETVRIGFIKDRVFYEKQILPKKVEKAIISRLKLQSNMNIDKSDEPQYGFFQIRVSSLKQNFCFHCFTLPTLWGESAIMHILWD